MRHESAADAPKVFPGLLSRLSGELLVKRLRPHTRPAQKDLHSCQSQASACQAARGTGARRGLAVQAQQGASPVALTDHLARGARPLMLQLSCRHNDWLDAAVGGRALS